MDGEDFAVSLNLTLPIPPSVNALYRAIGRGRNILSKEGRAWYAMAVPMIEMQAQGWFVLGKCELAFTVYYADRRRWDLSNRIKALEDALTKAGVWKDDDQVVRIVAEKGAIDKERPRVEVTITAL